jgi:NADP-dependent aldehyde dehydrogenase
LFTVTADAALANPSLLTEEQFGPAAIVVTYDDVAQVTAALTTVDGSLTATMHAEDDDPFPVGDLLGVLRRLVGRVIFNGWPTGVAVTWSMNHGGPWPSTTNGSHTSVGGTAVRRWQRPVCYQSVPTAVLPKALRDENPWRLPRRVDGTMTLG